MTGQQSAPGTATTLDAAIASKLRQLAALKRDIEQWGCEFAADDASIEGCQQLDAKARMLEAEIEELKSRAGPAWTSETQKAAEASVPEAAPPRPASGPIPIAGGRTLMPATARSASGCATGSTTRSTTLRAPTISSPKTRPADRAARRPPGCSTSLLPATMRKR